MRPFLQDLFERAGESVHLVVPAGPDARFIDGIEGDQPRVTAIGMSVRSRSGQPMAALLMATPTARFHRRQEPELSRHLREVCTAAEEALPSARP
jgi:DNA-binding IclR family transcriptional regulator